MRCLRRSIHLWMSGLGRCDGFPGAALEAMVNEAAIRAARRNSKTVGRPSSHWIWPITIAYVDLILVYNYIMCLFVV